MTNLSLQMLAANENHGTRAEGLMRRHGIEIDMDALDDFMLVVQNEFFVGVHHAYREAILTALSEELGTQQRIAAALGLKDRSSISQMVRSGTMDGIRVTAALYGFPEISLPTRELAALFGFARATSFIKAAAYGDQSIKGSMTAQEFSYLVGVLASDKWDSAMGDSNLDAARDFATEIIRERTIKTVPTASRPEQHVLMLQELRFKWGDFGVLALWAIPECIPEDDEDSEVTL